MIVEGVSFNENLVRRMRKKEFVAVHTGIFRGRSVEEQKRMLGMIYDRIKRSETDA